MEMTIRLRAVISLQLDGRAVAAKVPTPQQADKLAQWVSDV